MANSPLRGAKSKGEAKIVESDLKLAVVAVGPEERRTTTLTEGGEQKILYGQWLDPKSVLSFMMLAL